MLLATIIVKNADSLHTTVDSRHTTVSRDIITSPHAAKPAHRGTDHCLQENLLITRYREPQAGELLGRNERLVLSL